MWGPPLKKLDLILLQIAKNIVKKRENMDNAVYGLKELVIFLCTNAFCLHN